MPPVFKTVEDPESLNRPDDSAHEKFNQLTLKDTDDRDEDGHYRRTGAPSTFQQIACYHVEPLVLFALPLDCCTSLCCT